MHNHQHLKSINISKLGVIVLSIILITGISLVPILQIRVQGQGQQQQLPAPSSPPSPGGSPSSGTSPPPASLEAPPSPGGSPSSGTSPPPASLEAPPSPGGSPSSGTSPPLSLDAAAGGAANQTGEDSGAVNQSAMVMIPQSSVMKMIDNVQIAMGAVGDDEDAMMALESVDQELRSAATAAGIAVENTKDGGGGDTE